MTRIDTLIPRASGRTFHNGELSPAARASLSRAIEESAYEREGDDAWERVVIAYLPTHRDLERKTIREAAGILGVPAGEAVVELARASQGRAEIISHCLSRADVDAVVSLPYAAIASDGYALPVDAFGALPHPRSFGTFPRFLRRYVIEEKILSMGNAIKKISSLPAEIAGLPQVGRLAVGCRADVVVIDPSTLRDMADYTRPTQLPVGILDVIVGGQRMTINETGVARPAGTVLTRP
jgi:N-acyl-D-aspartate/D-glutamate deacylase